MRNFDQRTRRQLSDTQRFLCITGGMRNKKDTWEKEDDRERRTPKKKGAVFGDKRLDRGEQN